MNQAQMSDEQLLAVFIQIVLVIAAITWIILPFFIFAWVRKIIGILERSENMLYSIDKGVSNMEAKSREETAQ